MVTESTIKKFILWSFIGIVIPVLAITVIIQNRRINTLTREANNSYPQEETAEYRAENDRLKSQIADMQVWQDYLEGALNENAESSIPAPQNRPVENRVADNAPGIMNNPGMRNRLRSSISFRYDALAEEIGLSEETKSKLMDLLAEMQLETMNRMPGRRGFPPEMMGREAIRQQVEDINSGYNEKISELLSSNELYAFKEYRNSETERMLIRGFYMNISEDDNFIDNENQKELVDAMYSARQADPDTKRESDSLSFMGTRPAPMFGGIENDEKLNSVYIESAGNILSEDEMEKFEAYLNTRQSMPNMRRGFRPGRSQGAE